MRRLLLLGRDKKSICLVMKMWIWCCMGLLSLTAAQEDASLKTTNGWYTVVGSKVLRPNSDYNCAVFVSSDFPSSSNKINIKVHGKDVSEKEFEQSQTIEVEPSTNQLITLPIGDIGPGSYNLSVMTEGEFKHSNSSSLEFQSKSLSLFIQTDRAKYKPSSKILFRVLSLSSNMTPANATIDVVIMDGNGNRVKEWNQVMPTLGIWSGEIELSDSPVLGDWVIRANALDQKETKTFEVAEYVLPKFEVTINVPQNVFFNDSDVAVIVKAKYTYGRAVKGQAVVTMSIHSPYYFRNYRFKRSLMLDGYRYEPESTFSPVRKEVPIDGDAIVEFDIVKELGLKYRYMKRQVRFDVTVTDPLLGKSENASEIVKLHHEKYNLDLIQLSDHFKPGLKYDTYAKVTMFDGTPVTQSNMTINVETRYTWNGNYTNETSYELSPSGLTKLTFYPPQNITALYLKVKFGNLASNYFSATAAMSPSSNFIDASISTEYPKVDSEVEVAVNLTEHTPSVMYQVLGRGRILFASSVPIDDGAKTATFKFLATPVMAPKSKLIVYYIRTDGEVVADNADINIGSVLQNFVSIKTNADEYGPGQEVEFKLKAKPNSHLGLLGVDQSALLLKKGNDIALEDVEMELARYNHFDRRFDWQRDWTASRLFKESGVVVLTNGLVYREPPFKIYYEGANNIERISLNRGHVNGPPPLQMMPIAPGAPGFAAYGGAVAFSSGSSQPPAPPKLRSDFPETWIWETANTDSDGETFLRKHVPDTITSWVVSGFSIDPVYGLGLLDTPRKIKVFRPFFVSLNLPYSIIRGEMVSIPVIVFNYMDKEVTADITMENNAGQFEFAHFDDDNEISDGSKLDPYRKKKITVQPNSGESVSFMITATEIGQIIIKVTALSDSAGDAVERNLLVKPEGETQYKNQGIFVDLRSKDSMEKHVSIDIPKNFVKGSARIEVSAVGDILGTSLQNLEHLIRQPYGCGEQNMLNFVPNIVVLSYLKNSGQLTKPIEAKSLKFMDTGYQRELTYKHHDGSFSAFGNNDKSGSTWLTAFVLKSFISAEPYMKIDNDVIKYGLQWLAGKQTRNGSFPEVGTVLHKDMQGGAGQGLALTAYSLFPFLASQNKSEHLSTIDKAINYIAEQLDSIRNDNYALAITTYVLHLANHDLKDTAFNMLQANAETSPQASMKWWKRQAKISDEENPHAKEPNSVDVEITSYALHTYLERGIINEAMPILTWLLTQQNSDGGFASTQDTVVAIAALSKLAAKVFDKNPDITVQFSSDNGFSEKLHVTSENAMVLQKLQVPGNERELNIVANGKGFAVVQVSYSYNVNVTGEYPAFSLNPIVRNNSDSNHMFLEVCSSFVVGEEGDSSNMVVMEVMLPSGYEFDHDSMPELQASNNVKRVELKEAGTHVVLYFDEMTQKELCPIISAFKTHKVAKQQPVPVTVYDYYDQSRQTRSFYEPPLTTGLDICEGDDCRFFKTRTKNN